MKEELFGPVLTVYVYPENKFDEVFFFFPFFFFLFSFLVVISFFLQTLELCDKTSRYALTGALFASDRYALNRGADALRYVPFFLLFFFFFSFSFFLFFDINFLNNKNLDRRKLLYQ